MKILRKYADVREESSESNRFRRKRFSFFLSLIKKIPKPISIIDLGGTSNFWKKMSFPKNDEANITLVNIKEEMPKRQIFRSIIGDVSNLPKIKSKSFDLVFSNSVIEHMGTFDKQKRMANEVKRICKYYFIQTPNKYFPLEPHYLFPFFQFLPRNAKIWMVMHFNLGWFNKIESRQDAEKNIDEIRLLTKKELKELFPEAKIYKEKFLWMTKSFIIYKFNKKK